MYFNTIITLKELSGSNNNNSDLLNRTYSKKFPKLTRTTHKYPEQMHKQKHRHGYTGHKDRLYKYEGRH